MSDDFRPLLPSTRRGWTPGLTMEECLEEDTAEVRAATLAREQLRREVDAAVQQRELQLVEEEARRRQEHAAAVERLRQAEIAATTAEERLGDLILDLERSRAELLGEVRRGLGALVVAASTRIAGEALRVDPHLLDALVDEGMGVFGGEGLVIRLNPADHERVLRRLAGRSSVKVVADPQIDGGCVCEGPAGRIDATRRAAEAAIEAAVRQWERQ
jgi:flagellar biosynthesis/type III secretory pathway protein FliH